MWYKCNCKCSFCFVPEEVKEDKFTTNEVKEILMRFKKEGASKVYFGGGEPTLRKDLLKLISYAEKIRYKVIKIRTNGMLLCYPNFTNRCIKAGAKVFNIPIWGHTPQIHDLLSQTPGSFERMEMGIKNVVDLKGIVEADILITALSYKFIEDTISYFSDLGIKRFDFQLISLFGIEDKNVHKLLPKLSDIKPYLIKAFKTSEKKGLKDVFTSHIPPCFLGDFSHRYFNVKKLDLLIVAPKNSFKCEESPFEGGIKISACGHCRMSSNCLGLRKDYLSIYGSSEVKPILK